MNVLQAIFQFIKNNPGALVTLILIGAPIFSAIMKALAQKKQERDALARREQAQLDAMRTGRPVADTPADQVSARQRLEEIAQRRRQAIRQSGGQARTSQPPTLAAPQAPASTPGMRQIRLPGGIVLEVPEELTQPTPPPQAPPQPSPRPPSPERRKGSKRRASPQPMPTQPQAPARSQSPTAAEPQKITRSAQRAALAAAASESEPLPGPADPHAARPTPTKREAMRDAVGIGPWTRADWRRAIIMRELLGPPVGMR
ncbi:MAG: hypothetical protein HBSAPP03_19990 [Phycisphaerae bacterium]|nr:MAG: hypothetical protein HBSAPP03_19990 [Phycisphaerae bacterium]